jgi:hypothetical protein
VDALKITYSTSPQRECPIIKNSKYLKIISMEEEEKRVMSPRWWGFRRVLWG